jgi:hypothetical protein
VELIQLVTVIKSKKPNYREHPQFKLFFQKSNWIAVGKFFKEYFPIHATLYLEVIDPEISEERTYSRKELYMITRKFWDAWNNLE